MAPPWMAPAKHPASGSAQFPIGLKRLDGWAHYDASATACSQENPARPVRATSMPIILAFMLKSKSHPGRREGATRAGGKI